MYIYKRIEKIDFHIYPQIYYLQRYVFFPVNSSFHMVSFPFCSEEHPLEFFTM